MLFGFLGHSIRIIFHDKYNESQWIRIFILIFLYPEPGAVVSFMKFLLYVLQWPYSWIAHFMNITHMIQSLSFTSSRTFAIYNAHRMNDFINFKVALENMNIPPPLILSRFNTDVGFKQMIQTYGWLILFSFAWENVGGFFVGIRVIVLAPITLTLVSFFLPKNIFLTFLKDRKIN